MPMKWTASLAATATRQRLRVGVADVLGREAHQPARDVERILAGLEHARQPVERRVGVAVAHRLVQRRDEVVVLLAGLVVAGARAAGWLRSSVRAVDAAGRPSGAGRRRRGGQLEQVQRRPRVAVGGRARWRASASASTVDAARRRARARGPSSARAQDRSRARRRSAPAARTPASARAAPRSPRTTGSRSSRRSARCRRPRRAAGRRPAAPC